MHTYIYKQMSYHFHIFSHFLWTIKSGWRCDVRCVQSDYYYWRSKKEMHTKDLCQDHKLHTFTLTTLTIKTFVLAEHDWSKSNWSSINKNMLSTWRTMIKREWIRFNVISLTRLNPIECKWTRLKKNEQYWTRSRC